MCVFCVRAHICVCVCMCVQLKFCASPRWMVITGRWMCLTRTTGRKRVAQLSTSAIGGWVPPIRGIWCLVSLRHSHRAVACGRTQIPYGWCLPVPFTGCLPIKPKPTSSEKKYLSVSPTDCSSKAVQHSACVFSWVGDGVLLVHVKLVVITSYSLIFLLLSSPFLICSTASATDV